MFLLAFFLPPFAVFACGKPFQGVINLCIWLAAFPLGFFTIILGPVAWLIAFIHAMIAISDRKTTKRVNAITDAIRASQPVAAPAMREVPRAAPRVEGRQVPSFDFQWAPEQGSPNSGEGSGAHDAPSPGPSDVKARPAEGEKANLTLSETHSFDSRSAVPSKVLAAALGRRDQVVLSPDGRQPELESGSRSVPQVEKRKVRKSLRWVLVVLAYVILAATAVYLIPEARARAIGAWKFALAHAAEGKEFAREHVQLLAEMAGIIVLACVFGVASRFSKLAMPGVFACTALAGYLLYSANLFAIEAVAPVSKPSGLIAAPVAAAPIPTSEADQHAAALSAYRRVVMTRLATFQVYPPAARAGGVEGTSTVSFEIAPDGRVIAVGTVTGSGDNDIDAEAVSMVWKASPFPPPPPGAPTTYTVGIRFHIQ